MQKDPVHADDVTTSYRYMGSRAFGVVRGGNLNNGANAGPFNVNVNNSFSNANVNNGARVDSSRPEYNRNTGNA